MLDGESAWWVAVTVGSESLIMANTCPDHWSTPVSEQVRAVTLRFLKTARGREPPRGFESHALCPRHHALRATPSALRDTTPIAQREALGLLYQA
jgi:hypothetical protein